MKTLLEFLINKPITTLKEPISEEEILQDYDGLSWKSTHEKKMLDKKYHVGSIKWKDIEKKMLELLREFRCKKHEFTSEDIKYFNRLEPSQVYNKFETLAKQESFEFMKYYKDYKERILKKRPVRGNKTLFDYVNVNLGRQWNYYYTGADKYQLDLYKNAVRYLKENNQL